MNFTLQSILIIIIIIIFLSKIQKKPTLPKGNIQMKKNHQKVNYFEN